MCIITATELKNNLSKYMSLSKTEDVYVTKGKQIITVLTSSERKTKADFFSLFGVLGNGESADYENALSEEIFEHANSR